MEKQPLTGSEQKIQEYANRIRSGESKDTIFEGLPPSFIKGIEAELEKTNNASEPEPGNLKTSEQQNQPIIPVQYEGLDYDTLEFIWTIPEYTDTEKTKKEKQRKQRALDFLRKKELEDMDKKKTKLYDEVEIEKIKKRLGIDSDETLKTKQEELDSLEKKESNKNHLILGLIKYVCHGKSQAVIDLYKRFFDDIDNQNSRKSLISALFQGVYNKYRLAEYEMDTEEEKTWEDALKNNEVGVNNKKKEWMYRGVFSGAEEETVTRGSFNVHVTPELIASLDEIIKKGKIKANYKFGQPGTTASPTERHDSISIYFLEQPTEETLQELSDIIKPYVRGDNLLGKKISDGFFMSEIGSVESKHIISFIEMLQTKDPAFGEAVKVYTSPQPGRGDSLKMSEAQYYAIKDVARAFGYNISYDKNTGFKILD